MDGWIPSHHGGLSSRAPPALCSAGIGRTGTLIAVHTALTRFALGLETSVFDVVRQLKEERSGMVQRKVSATPVLGDGLAKQ